MFGTTFFYDDDDNDDGNDDDDDDDDDIFRPFLIIFNLHFLHSVKLCFCPYFFPFSLLPF